MADDSRKPVRVRVGRWKPDDIDGIVECHTAAYNDYPLGTHYDRRLYELAMAAFPEGQLLAEHRGKIVGYATSLIVQLDEDVDYTWDELTGAATFSSHNPSGDTLYGADIAVHPDYRGRGVAGRLYEHRLRIMRRYNLRRMVAYGRLPGYPEWAGKMTPEEYVAEVVADRIKDPALTAHIKAGYKVRRVMFELFADRSSMDHSTFLERENPDYNAAKRKLAAPPLKRTARRARVCAAQYQMRTIASWAELERNVEFFVNAADTYHSHFLLFPELFTMQMLSSLRDVDTQNDYRAAVGHIADMHDQYLAMFTKFATEWNLHIIGGSHPVRRDGKIYNVAHLFSPSGKVYTQDKLHITPSERQDFGISPGDGLKIFDTPHGRIAILVCYDLEFPELGRALALAGVEAIMCPFSTDERKAYNRIRYSAHARAVENYVYVAIAGNVGNLPHRSYLLNYGQAAIITPSDFGFAPNGVAAEADPNVETVVVGDLDYEALNASRETGSVLPLRDRRIDLYEVKMHQPIQVVRVD